MNDRALAIALALANGDRSRCQPSGDGVLVLNRPGQRFPEQVPLPEPVVAPELPAEATAPQEPTNAEVRSWAISRGYKVSSRGRLPASVVAEYLAAHSQRA